MIQGPLRFRAPLKQIKSGLYGDLIITYPKAIFYLLKGDYRVEASASGF